MTEEESRALGNIEGKLDRLIASITRHFDDDRDAFSKINDRLGKVERKTYLLSSTGAIIGSVAGYFAHTLMGKQ